MTQFLFLRDYRARLSPFSNCVGPPGDTPCFMPQVTEPWTETSERHQAGREAGRESSVRTDNNRALPNGWASKSNGEDRPVNLICILFSTAILFVSPLLASAQATLPVSPAPARQSKQPSKLGEPTPVVFWNRQITVFRSYYDQASPAERAARTAERLASFPEVARQWDIVVNETSNERYSGSIVTVNGALAVIILEDDLDPESGETIKSVADQAAAQLRAALEARAQQRRLPVLLRGIGLALAATALLILALWLLLRGGRLLLARMDRAARARSRRLKIGGLDLQPLLDGVNRGLTKMTLRAAAVVLIYLWLTFVLLRFPYSQPWGRELGSFLINLFAMLGTGFLHAVPGIFTVVVIFLLARVVARLVNGIFGEVEKGDLEVSWLHPDTAHATRRLLVVLVWIFALTVAYRYIPGSSSDAFKGISVLLGLMVSLGSAGLVNQVMSGLVVIYSRALQPGEFVSIGSDMGQVSEVGMLSTKILTRKREGSQSQCRAGRDQDSELLAPRGRSRWRCGNYVNDRLRRALATSACHAAARRRANCRRAQRSSSAGLAESLARLLRRVRAGHQSGRALRARTNPVGVAHAHPGRL